MSAIFIDQDSAIARRRRLYDLIRREDLSSKPLDELLPGGEPHHYEKQLWDYKLELPVLTKEAKPNEFTKRQFD
jgi:hypothetical protein